MAASSIAKRLFEALKKIDRPGSFCVRGSLPAVLPGLEIDQLGSIALPLTTHQAKEVIEQCEQAPYGKGALTLVDKKVRRVWQLMPDSFKLTNPGWKVFLAQMTKTVQEGLGLEGKKLEAHLYNLLLYEKGSFFLPHRDGEKLDGMVATLVVVLPSEHEGGELVIRHEGEEETIDFASDESSKHDIHFAAFYADCEHEVHPLRKGYRLCLVYNLVLTKSKKAITAPRSAEYIEAVGAVLRGWVNNTSEDVPAKLAVLLEHRYTKDGLTWEALKGVDAARARVLREAAGRSGCKAFLATVTLWETGAASYDDDYSGGYGRDRYYEDEDDEDEDEEDSEKEEDDEEDISGKYEMEEVFDSNLTAEHWVDSDGNRLSFGNMKIEEEEIIPEEGIHQVKPEEEFEGYTGNAGMTLERWYRHGAIVLWPEKWHYDNLCDCGTSAAISALRLLVKQWKSAGQSEKAALKAQCVRFATSIIAQWQPEYSSSSYGEEEQTICDLSPDLVALNEPQLIQAYLTEVLPKDHSVELSDSLLKVCAKHRWDNFLPAFEGVFSKTVKGSLKRNARLLEQLCSLLSRSEEEREQYCKPLAQVMLSALEEVDRKRSEHEWYEHEPDRSGVLIGLVKAMVVAELHDFLERLVEHVQAVPKKYPLISVQVKALAGLRSWLKSHVKEKSKGLSRWLASCREQLEGLTAETPTEPADFRREANLHCKCADCGELAKFLKDPREPVHRFSVRQERRNHLENTIRNDHCDVQCVTERKGSPQTLICTKNTATYKRKLKEYHENLEHLALVKSIETNLR